MHQEEITVDTELYRFAIKAGDPTSVLVIASPKAGEATRVHVNEIEALLKNMGKWEILVSASTDLLHSLGFDMSKHEPFDYLFGYERYNIEDLETTFARGTNVVSCTVWLEKEERHRREATKTATLSPREIACQIENIPKWLNLENCLRALRGISSAPKNQ